MLLVWNRACFSHQKHVHLFFYGWPHRMKNVLYYYITSWSIPVMKSITYVARPLKGGHLNVLKGKGRLGAKEKEITHLFLAMLAAGLQVEMLVCWLVHPFDPDWNISTTTGGIAVKFGTDIHGLQRIKPNDFDNPMTLRLAPLWSWLFFLIWHILSDNVS